MLTKAEAAKLDLQLRLVLLDHLPPVPELAEPDRAGLFDFDVKSTVAEFTEEASC